MSINFRAKVEVFTEYLEKEEECVLIQHTSLCLESILDLGNYRSLRGIIPFDVELNEYPACGIRSIPGRRAQKWLEDALLAGGTIPVVKAALNYITTINAFICEDEHSRTNVVVTVTWS